MTIPGTNRRMSKYLHSAGALSLAALAFVPVFGAHAAAQSTGESTAARQSESRATMLEREYPEFHDLLIRLERAHGLLYGGLHEEGEIVRANGDGLPTFEFEFDMVDRLTRLSGEEGRADHAAEEAAAGFAVLGDKAAEVIASTPYTLGYIDFGAAEEMGLPMARLENHAGRYIAPGLESGQLALAAAAEQQPDVLTLDVTDPEGDSAYPLVVLSSIYFPERHPEAEKAKAIRLWMIHGLADEQQETAARQGYIALPEGLLEAAREAARRTQ